MKISAFKAYYLIGIKGVGMTSLALCLKQMGGAVSGSDIPYIFGTDAVLKKHGIRVYEEFSPSHIKRILKNTDPSALLVIASGAHNKKTNVELACAIALGIPVLTHGQALGMVMDQKRGISVSGTHGKSTTSAMIAHCMSLCGLDPSYAVGVSEILSLPAPGKYGRGEWFIAEADEYISAPGTDITPRFLYQHPEIGIVTSVDFDHPDAYASLSHVEKSFLSFTKNIRKKGLLIVCKDGVSDNFKKQLRTHALVTYGFEEGTDFKLTKYESANEKAYISLTDGQKNYEFALQVPGEHNALNATGAIIACLHAGIAWKRLREAIASFSGTSRRFEKRGERDGVLYYDDYAHHPREIAATLSAVRQWFPDRRIVVVFQPHTYSRTKALFSAFATSFSDADCVFIADIYASAREEHNGSVSASALAVEVQKSHGHADYAKSARIVQRHLSKGDILITMGAGDIYTWHDRFLGRTR